MTPPNQAMRRVVLGLGAPAVAFAVQAVLWDAVFAPFVWFMFYPAVFASSWLGGLRVGLVSTILSVSAVWWYFVPPQRTWVKDPKFLLSAAVFVAMGVLFSLFHEQLRRATAEATAALARTRELDDLKNQFFASVSHELRTPLALISGPTERLLAAPDLGEQVRRELEVVARNAKMLRRHVDDLLDVARLEAGRMLPSYADTDIAGLTRWVGGHFDGVAEEKSIAYRLDVQEPLRAEVDPDQLRHVLLNLLSNAFKFTPTGGIVRLTARPSADRVRFEVADSGPGVPEDKRQAVFERFRQLEGGTTRRFGGTGLGLAIARDLVGLHRGSLSVETAPEGGALFVVDLPLRAPVGAPIHTERAESPLEPILEQPVAAGTPVSVGPESGALVLVAEDNPEMNRFLCQTLGSRYRVRSVADGREALAAVDERTPDLIVTDVMMPNLSGEDLVAALRARSELELTPIVVLTARVDDALRVRLLRAGAQDFLTKPFGVEELRARVDNLIARKRAEERARELADRLTRLADAGTALSEAVAGLPENSLNAVLKTICVQAQGLTAAKYAAVGLGSDPTRSFEPFLYVGLTEAEAHAIGPHPRPVGALGEVAVRGRVVRSSDVRSMPEHRGFPPNHPVMRSFLGVPIRFRGNSVGNLYLAEKLGAEAFTDADQRIVEMLASRAGVAIETAALYRSEGRGRAWLQMVVDQMPEGVILVDEHGKIATRNRFVRSLEAATGETDSFGNPILLDLRHASGERLAPTEFPAARAFLGEDIARTELVAHKEGETTPLLVSAAPVRGRDGEVVGATMVLQDITGMKELERLREEWASIVAHDLKQPVTAIGLSVELMSRLADDASGDKRARAFARLRAANDRLARMIDDLLDVTRIETGRLPVRRSAIALVDRLRAVLGAAPELAPRCDVLLERGSEVPVLADGDRVEQVMSRLLANAAQYGDPTGRIRIRVSRADTAVEVTVTNMGPGIPRDELKRLFRRFERSKEARAGRASGLGMSLYICRGVIEAQGGRIWAESEPGETSFHFTLPLASET